MIGQDSISLGTSSWGIKVSEGEARTIVAAFYAAGIPWLYQVNASPFTENLESRIALIKSLFPTSAILGYNLLGGLVGQGMASPMNRVQEIRKSLSLNSNVSKTQVIQAVLKRRIEAGLNGFILGPTTREHCQEWITAIKGLRNEEI